jgi:hypothetical protein
MPPKKSEIRNQNPLPLTIPFDIEAMAPNEL